MRVPGIVLVRVPGPIVPWQRPENRARGGRRTSGRSRAYRERLAYYAVQARPAGWPLDARYRVEVAAAFPDRRVRDLDNIAKQLLDALNRILWRDDGQVDALSVVRLLDRESPALGMVVSTITQRDGEGLRPQWW